MGSLAIHIRELCPSPSLSSVAGALRGMVAEGEIMLEGAGKNTFYYRIKCSQTKQCPPIKS